MGKFVMKRAPVKPRRNMVQKALHCAGTVQNLLDMIVAQELQPKDVSLPSFYERRFIFYAPEDAVSYGTKLRKYEDELAKYKLWEEKHKDEIELYHKKKAIRDEKRRQAKIEALSKQREEIERQLAELKELQK